MGITLRQLWKYNGGLKQVALFALSNEWQTNAEIGRKCQTPASTVADTMKRFVDYGLVERYQEHPTKNVMWRLGGEFRSYESIEEAVWKQMTQDLIALGYTNSSDRTYRIDSHGNRRLTYGLTIHQVVGEFRDYNDRSTILTVCGTLTSPMILRNRDEKGPYHGCPVCVKVRTELED